MPDRQAFAVAGIHAAAVQAKPAASGDQPLDLHSDGHASGAGAPLLAAALVLAALVAGVIRQGGFFASGQRLVAAPLAAALVIAMVARRPALADLRLAPPPVAVALAVWALLDGAISGAWTSALGYALLLSGITAALLVCRRLDAGARTLLLDGLLAVGLLAAATGWAGVVWRLRPWALADQGLWRAASTIGYDNATAALLVPLAVLALARHTNRPHAVGSALVATGLLAGAGATASRAGGISLLAGLILLALLLGIGRLTRALAGPLLGASVVLVALLPSVPVAAPSRPLLAIIGLAVGLGVAALLSRLPAPQLGAAVLLLAVGLAASHGPAPLVHAAKAVRTVRISAASADRAHATGAALRLLRRQPLLGTGPGNAAVAWTDVAGKRWHIRYIHNEYLQVAAELGAVGAVLLALLLGALCWQAWTARTTAASRALWAGVLAALAALAIHSSADFIWHVPVIALTAAVLVGLLLPPPTPPRVPSQPHRPVLKGKEQPQ